MGGGSLDCGSAALGFGRHHQKYEHKKGSIRVTRHSNSLRSGNGLGGPGSLAVFLSLFLLLGGCWNGGGIFGDPDPAEGPAETAVDSETAPEVSTGDGAEVSTAGGESGSEADEGPPPSPAYIKEHTPPGNEAVSGADSLEAEPGITAQQLLEDALDACTAAQTLWEEGKLEEALDTLDSAYGNITRVTVGDDPILLQQKNDLRFLISRRIVEIYASRQTAVDGNGRTIPLLDNTHVRNAIKVFQTKERKFFLESYRRSGWYRAMIVEELRKAGLPEDLSWLPLIESGFKLKALSRARALGPWQFIPSTGYRYGLSRDQWVDERMSPEKSTQAAIAYLTNLHNLFGDWTTALAGYNCGEANVLRAIRAQQINYLDDFWDLYERLPRETAGYVPRFIATLKIVSDPGAYGFELPEPYPPLAFETVTINRAVKLAEIGKRIGVSEEDLKDLNPELRHASTPERSYDLQVPVGKGETVLAVIGEVPRWQPPKATYVVHRVRSGETVSGIAKRYRTSIKAIARLNRMKRADRIWPGQRLKIPVRGSSGGYASKPPPLSFPKGTPVKYTVVRGDTLHRIARRFGTTVSEIKKASGLTSDRLEVGQSLTIASGPPAGATIYTVRKGDTLGEIADRHKMDLSKLLELNRLSKRSTIYPGQEVWVIPQ